MESSTTGVPPPNPPSVEAAYKRKCIALKKRLNEIEAENELMRIRNQRGLKYVQKMRLESCILLERLAKVTGMQDEAHAGVSPELRARAAALMSNAAALNGAVSNIAGGGENGTASGYIEDETEGSSDEQPPTVSISLKFFFYFLIVSVLISCLYKNKSLYQATFLTPETSLKNGRCESNARESPMPPASMPKAMSLQHTIITTSIQNWHPAPLRELPILPFLLSPPPLLRRN